MGLTHGTELESRSLYTVMDYKYLAIYLVGRDLRSLNCNY